MRLKLLKSIRKSVEITIGLVFFLILAATPCKAEMIEGIVAVVDDSIIMMTDLLSRMDQLKISHDNPRAFQEVLDFMIEELIVEKTYRSMGLTPVSSQQIMDMTSRNQVSYHDARSLIMRKSLMDVMVQSRVVITENMIKEYYEQNQEYSGRESVHLNQILLKDIKNTTSAAMQEIKDGKPFSEVAIKYSSVLVSGSPDIGWTDIDDFCPELKQLIQTAKTGDILGPVKVGESVFIFEVIERKVRKSKEFDEVRDQIEKSLEDKYRQEAFEHWLKNIMSKHFIGVYI